MSGYISLYSELIKRESCLDNLFGRERERDRERENDN